MPCTAPSASASSVKIASARLRTGGFDASGLQPCADIREAHVAVIVGLNPCNLEAGAGKRRVPVRVDGDCYRRRQPEPCERSPQAVRKVRARVQHRRGEHVAGDAAYGIEVKARQPDRSGRTRRYAGIRVRRCGRRCVVQGYSPLKTGLRFSVNEATPSAKSADERSLP